MRPKIAMWSDYGAPTPKHWRSPYRRTTQSSIGPKILVVASVLVAGVVGISGIYPQVIDAEWVQNSGTDSKRLAHSEGVTTRRIGVVAAIPLPPRRAATTTGEAEGSAPRSAASAGPSTLDLKEPESSFAAVELPLSEIAPPRGELPETQAKADPSAEPAAAIVRKQVERFARAPVKRRVVRNEHRHSYSGAYAQYGGWGGFGGWGGYSNYRRF